MVHASRMTPSSSLSPFAVSLFGLQGSSACQQVAVQGAATDFVYMEYRPLSVIDQQIADNVRLGSSPVRDVATFHLFLIRPQTGLRPSQSWSPWRRCKCLGSSSSDGLRLGHLTPCQSFRVRVPAFPSIVDAWGCPLWRDFRSWES